MDYHNSMPVHSGLIVRGLKVPARGTRGMMKYNWGALEVGDALFLEIEKDPASNAASFGRRNGSKFTSRKYIHEGKNGYMVWRIV